MTIPVAIEFTEPSPGVFVYENNKFFPIDGMGFGNGPVSTGIVIPGFPPIGGSTLALDRLIHECGPFAGRTRRTRGGEGRWRWRRGGRHRGSGHIVGGRRGRWRTTASTAATGCQQGDGRAGEPGLHG